MDRYNRLVLTLRKMPPERTAEQIWQRREVAVALDSASTALAQADTLHAVVETPDFVKDSLVLRMDDATIAVRDSCLYVAEQIVAYYWQQLQQIDKDNEYYQQTDELLRSAYDYAQERYAAVQEKLFVEGQGNYFKTLNRLPFRLKKARADVRSRYSLKLEDISEQRVISSWRGPIVYFYSLMLLLILVVATAVATLVVNVGLKKTPLFASEWFLQRKGMVIALLGDVLFGIFLLVNTQLTDNTFIQRSLGMMGEFAWLIAAIFTSLLIRLEHDQNHVTIQAYLPTLIMAFMIIYFRIIFIPNSVINLVYPALVLVFTIWQFRVATKKLKKVATEDKWLLWTGAAVMLIATLISWAGVVMGSLLLMIWWMFQLALLETLIALSELLTRYHERHVKERKLQYRQANPSLPLSSKNPGAFIEVTWLYDFLKRESLFNPLRINIHIKPGFPYIPSQLSLCLDGSDQAKVVLIDRGFDKAGRFNDHALERLRLSWAACLLILFGALQNPLHDLCLVIRQRGSADFCQIVIERHSHLIQIAIHGLQLLLRRASALLRQLNALSHRFPPPVSSKCCTL
jgi:hypothetical protein